MIGFGFTFDWIKKGREYFKPIMQRCNVKLITFRYSNHEAAVKLEFLNATLPSGRT